MIDMAVTAGTADNASDTRQFDDEIGFLIGRSRAVLTKSLDNALAAWGITHAQGNLLQALASGRCGTAAELARDASVDAAAMTRMIDRLERRQLVQRMPRGDDRRVVRVQLTEAGSRLASELPKLYAHAMSSTFSTLQDAELAQLRYLLQKFVGGNAAGRLESNSVRAVVDAALQRQADLSQ